MWHPVRGEALVSVYSIYNPPRRRHYPWFPSVSLGWFSVAFSKKKKKISFTFKLPLFKKKNHFCVYQLCLPLSLPFFLVSPLSLRLSLPALSLCSVNLWQTLLPFPAWNQNSSTEILPKKKRKREKHIGKHHSPDISLFFFFDVFHLISLTSHLPLTKTSIHYRSHWASLLIFFMLLGGNFKKLSRTRRNRRNRGIFTALTCLSRLTQLDVGPI